MSNARRRLWGRSESDPPADPSDAQEEGNPQRVVDRLSEYAFIKSRSDPAQDQAPVDEPDAEQEAATTRGDVPADFSALGDEVGAVLGSAQEAAAAIRRGALEEAAKRRDEAHAEAEAAIAEARQIGDAEREAGERSRADAETHAAQTRAAADNYAEQRRTEAEREAAMIAAEAQSRLDAADAEVERKARKAEADVRGRVDMLKAEAERYEERLNNIFVVFREMSSQLEELLGAQTSPASESAAADEGLEEALRRDSSTLPVS